MINWEALGDRSLIEFLWQTFIDNTVLFWVPPLLILALIFDPIRLLLKFLGINEIFGLRL
jgi:hypothetical protein